MTSEVETSPPPRGALFEKHVADVIAALFVTVIVLYAASGPLNEFIRWVIETTTPAFDEMSRRDQRVFLREHWLGAAHRAFEQGFLLPTGLIIGLPIVLSFAITLLTLHRKPGLRAVNWALTALAVSAFTSWIVAIFASDAGILPTARGIDYVMFPLATAITLYLTWRLFGGFIVGFCLFWVVYFFVKGWLPDWTGILAGSEATFSQNLRQMILQFWAQTGGMFGQPIQVVTGNVLIFIVFGAVLMASGAGDLLMKIANRLTGGLTGGAAHASVASSALFGTLSGAAISNVVSTGVMTIPVIRKAGFKPAFAGAVEAAASTGGQIMPPVMGVVAFFVAGQIGLEYRYIVVAAIIPAIFYYLGTFLAVYFEARKRGVGALPASERPKLTRSEWVQCLVFVIPLGTLSYFLFAQPSVPKAGFYGLIAALASASLLFRDFRSGRRLWTAFVDAGRMAATIVIIVTAIGLIVGLIQTSGFAGRLSQLLAEVADGPLPLVLLVVALGAIVLGMGLPPGATYFIIVIALSSGIDTVGIAPLTLHLFVVVFAMMSTVTPPVALAAFAAAPIAGADPIKTGFEAAKISLAGFLIPFVFVYHPAVLYKLQVIFEWFGEDRVNSRAMIDIATVTWFDFFWILGAFTLAMWLIASALAGFDRSRLSVVERALRLTLGGAALLPQLAIAAPAAGLGLALLLASPRLARRAGPAAP
ncbi:MAG: TRAP transporter fused permease subunit [Marinovum algicola]|jgi:TRAP transporter 4TM/12TM fusion protein|uniref:TRAP transporter, 4TM/12TM fusion protein n=1 Tax=Marinovum algicola TaxID=42444 RepID=A0A975ZPP2_9RHOB|nr:TRAP transporter fused permease subunit [Marinovum algicola]SEJ92678.1 TRAP transporter, 4TM/12TM fusion protein [Marinovum algicola]SLN65960.1 Sialic acid TRAP transporter permease protein SiaT [Marinovum algicola]